MLCIQKYCNAATNGKTPGQRQKQKEESTHHFLHHAALLPSLNGSSAPSAPSHSWILLRWTLKLLQRLWYQRQNFLVTSSLITTKWFKRDVHGLHNQLDHPLQGGLERDFGLCRVTTNSPFYWGSDNKRQVSQFQNLTCYHHRSDDTLPLIWKIDQIICTNWE